MAFKADRERLHNFLSRLQNFSETSSHARRRPRQRESRLGTGGIAVSANLYQIGALC